MEVDFDRKTALVRGKGFLEEELLKALKDSGQYEGRVISR